MGFIVVEKESSQYCVPSCFSFRGRFQLEDNFSSSHVGVKSELSRSVVNVANKMKARVSECILVQYQVPLLRH